MRAWLLHEGTEGPAAFRMEEAADPTPGPGQVVVATKIAGLNHLDVWMSHAAPKPPSYPHIPGADAAGLIVEVGQGVSGWAPGDEVIINPSVSCGTCARCVRDQVVFCRDFEIFGEHRSGTLAEKVLLFQRNLVRKPTAMSWEVAGCYGLVTGTAYRMLMKARLQSAEKVLVVGVGGGVSSTAMLMAKATGAKVWVTSRSPHKIDWALANGAEAGFDSSEPFSKAVKAATDGGADLVVDNVGPATWEQSVRSLAMGGRVVVVGGTSGQKVELSLPVVFFKHIEVIGSTMFNHGEFARATNMVATGAVPVPIDRVFPFEELPEALTRLEQGDQLGKIGVRVSS